MIVGCYMKDGKVIRNSIAHVLRDDKEVFVAKVASLRRFKDDVKEVLAGYECGIGLENSGEVQKGDTLQFYKLEETAADGT